jgi:hypothetical protein
MRILIRPRRPAAARGYSSRIVIDAALEICQYSAGHFNRHG